MKSVYSAVRTGSLNKAVCALSLSGYMGCLRNQSSGSCIVDVVPVMGKDR